MKVAIDALLLDGHAGGTQQVVIGLASGLSKLTDSDDEYIFMPYRGADEWLRPYVSGPCRIVPSADPPIMLPHRGMIGFLRGGARRVRDAVALARGPASVPIARSHGTPEREKADVVHFPTQLGFLTSIPSIYHPWDLQHIHLPHLFSRYQRMVRDTRYRRYCEQARIVCVAAEWTRQDFIQHFHLSPDKVAVVPMAPATDAYAAPTAETRKKTAERLQLPERFLFYPAQTFRHKNHIALLEAVALLRDEAGLRVNVICSGTKNEFYPEIDKRLQALRLADQVSFVGYISTEELRALYDLAHAVVFPTLFEGWGLPVFEAFAAGKPVACSSVTSLPESAGDAALFFQPEHPREIAEAMRRLWEDDALCRDLAARGVARVQEFSWEKTARMFRDLYRRVASHATPAT